MRVHLAAALVAVAAGVILCITSADWAVVAVIGLVLTAETLNTVVEVLVDLCTEEYPMAKAAKDMAAGAVLISSAAAVGVGVAPPTCWVLGWSVNHWLEFESGRSGSAAAVHQAVRWSSASAVKDPERRALSRSASPPWRDALAKECAARGKCRAPAMMTRSKSRVERA